MRMLFFCLYRPFTSLYRCSVVSLRAFCYNAGEVSDLYNIDKHAFGEFVMLLRKEKGLTQKEVAQQLFISDKAVSKWETGASIPDTALLIPLADLLGVSVTELLMCQRITQQPLDTQQVESLVKTAITYSEDEIPRAWKTKSRWPMIYIFSVLIGGLCLCLNLTQAVDSLSVLLGYGMGAGFGLYFCFLAKTKLPAYYDENRINSFSDGPLRMNLPGVSFNNQNWPYIVRVGRIWSCAVTALYPLFALAMAALLHTRWPLIERYVFLLIILGGLFIPLYIVGKKHG